MHYSSKTGGFAPADFLLQIIGLKIDYNQLLLAKSELFEGRNSKNGEFMDRFQLNLMGFLTTSLHKNSQNDFDIYWARELIFTQIRNTLIFIKNHHELQKLN